MSKKLTYRDAGVDIDAMDRTLSEIRSLARGTATAGVVGDIGGFGGLYRPDADSESLLVASVDGVGTKLRIAIEAGVHDTVGADLVNHCVNDILVQGAEPLFFMDYFATGRLEPHIMVDVVRGIARACRDNGCALLGGETAEMPGFYASGDYDVAGFIVGRVDRNSLINGERIRPGDRLIGLRSSGLHTNGYSLARKVIFEVKKLGIRDPFPEGDGTVGDVLLAEHRSYLAPMRGLLGRGVLHGIAHITGGGLTDNLPRILPDGLTAEIELESWPIPPLFRLLGEWGSIQPKEMLRTFNLGIGLVAAVAEAEVAKVSRHLEEQKEEVHLIGRVVEGERGVIYLESRGAGR